MLLVPPARTGTVWAEMRGMPVLVPVVSYEYTVQVCVQYARVHVINEARDANEAVGGREVYGTVVVQYEYSYCRDTRLPRHDHIRVYNPYQL